jgi:hypothetical protein
MERERGKMEEGVRKKENGHKKNLMVPWTFWPNWYLFGQFVLTGTRASHFGGTNIYSSNYSKYRI